MRTSTILLAAFALFAAGEFIPPAAAHPALARPAPLIRDLTLQTADGIMIDARLYDASNEDVIIYAHRLLGDKEGGEVERLARNMADRYDLLTFAFRGHKSSFGTSTVAGNEILDLRAALSYAKSRGYRRIAVFGAGMGGTVGWRTAEIFGNIDALIVISPSGFSSKAAPFVIGLASDRILPSAFGRVPLRIIAKTRLDIVSSPGYPLALTGLPGNIPTLIVQSEEDRFVDAKRLEIIFEGLDESNTLAFLPGKKHAEDLIDTAMIARMRAFLDSLFVRDAGAGAPRRMDAAGTDAAPRDASRVIPVILTGDSPLPESAVLDELDKRLLSRVAEADSAAHDAQFVLRELRDIYSMHGYVLASLSIADSSAPYAVEISIPTIRSVAIAGNQWVAEDYIRGIARVGGDYYNAYELDRAVRRISSQPAIHSAAARPAVRDDGDVDILLAVTEQRPYRFSVATKFTDIDDFFGIGFTWNEVNPTALRYEGRTMVGISKGDMLMTHTLAKDMLGNALHLSATVFHDMKSRDDLDYVFKRQEVHEIGGEFAAGYRVFPSMEVTLGAFGKKYESPEVSFDMPVAEGIAGGIRCMIDLSSSLPRRYPRFAWRSTLYYEKSGPYEIGDFSFDTYQINVSGDLRIGRHHTSRTTLHGGWQAGNPPPQEEFSLGGMTTLPGYRDDSFVGKRVALARQALYFSARSLFDETSVWEPLRLILYGDAGAVWPFGASFPHDDLHIDAGIEFDYMEILRAGCVWPVGRSREESPRVYIGWGVHVL